MVKSFRYMLYLASTSMFFLISGYMYYYFNNDDKIGIVTTNNMFAGDGIYNDKGTARSLKDTLLDYAGVSTFIIDYNSVISPDDIKLKYITLDKENMERSIREDVKSTMEKFLSENSIKRVVIPGNTYNLQHEPYSAIPNRMWISQALISLAEEGKIKLLGICGGMQEVLHYKGVSMLKLAEYPKSYNVEAHEGLNYTNYLDNYDEFFIKQLLKSDSKLGKLYKEDQNIITDDAWIEAVNLERHTIGAEYNDINVKKLQAAGYEVTLISNDGMIEGIEDKLGNMYVQGHPELSLQFFKKGSEENKELRIKGASLAKVLFDNFIQ